MDPSELDSGGVSAPELEVQVLERDPAGSGRVKTGTQTKHLCGCGKYPVEHAKLQLTSRNVFPVRNEATFLQTLPFQ